MNLGRIGKTAALVFGMVLLAGCEKAGEEVWVPREAAAISIDKDGTVTEYLSDELDQAYYSFDELNQMLAAEAAEYNSGHGEGCVTVTSAEQDGKNVNLVITYASGEDYAQFNNVEFYYGSMINAQLAGYLFDVSYKEVSDGVIHGDAVSGTEVLRHMADQVVVVRAPLEVHVPGSVIFTSTNASVLARDVVLASGADEEQPSVTGEQQTAEERDALDRVYIVFTEE